MKIFYTILVALVSFTMYSQKETCNSPKEEQIEDLNSITKCSIQKSSKNKNKRNNQLTVRVSAPKKRYLKKRSVLKNKANSAGNINAAGVSSSSKHLNINKILSISNRLSSEEVKKAHKFISVDEVPAFKKCINTSGDKRLDCFNSEMISHIEKYFNYPNEALIKKIEGEVWVRFIIDKNGNISNIKALGPKNGELLKEEAIRVVSQLPVFVPAKKNGSNTSVKYGFPINFSLN